MKVELKSYSAWFKASLIILALIYLSFWFFTIYLAQIQKASNLEPVLPIIAEDSLEYATIAESFGRGEGFTQHGKPEFLHTPGYPFFVTFVRAINGSYFAVTLIQIILAFAAALVLRKIGVAFASPLVGEIAAVLLLVNPVTLTLASLVLTDILFLFLYLTGFYLAFSLRPEKIISQTLVFSLIFALALHVRPMGGILVLPLVAAPIIISRTPARWRIISIGLMVVVLLAALTPWTIRNYRLSGTASFSSFRSANLYAVMPAFLAKINGTTVAEETKIFETRSGVLASDQRDLRYAKVINTTVGEVLRAQPVAYLRFHLTAAVPFFFPLPLTYGLTFYRSAMGLDSLVSGPGIINFLLVGDWQSFLAGVFTNQWKLLERAIWFPVLILALVGWWAKRKSLTTWAFVAIIAYLMFMSGSAANPRYALQSWPFMFLLTAAGVVFFRDRWLSR